MTGPSREVRRKLVAPAGTRDDLADDLLHLHDGLVNLSKQFRDSKHFLVGQTSDMLDL